MGTLVIGVGGTGYKTLCLIKANLQVASPDGQVPSNVQLRAIDTVPYETVSKDSAVLDYGGVHLADFEFIYLGKNPQPIGANLNPVAQALIRGGLPQGNMDSVQKTDVSHFTSWFQTDTLLRIVPPSTWNITMGALQLRQVARLALFWNVQAPLAGDFHPKMSAAVQAARVGSDLNVLLFGSTKGEFD